MSFRLTRAAGVVALTCAASALALPLAAPAHAVTGTERAFVVADTDGDGTHGLYTRAPGGGALTDVVPDTLPVDIYNLSSSADGSRVIYVQINLSSSGAPVSQQVTVRDVSTKQVQVLDKRAWDDINFLGVPALSPHGTEAVWENYNGVADTVTTRKSVGGLGTGKATSLAAGLTPYGFLDDDTVLVQDVDGNASTISLSGTPGTVTGLPVEALNVAISPDLQHLAFGFFSSTSTASMRLANVALVGNNATVSGVDTLSALNFNHEPSFSHDGTKLYWIHSADGTLDSSGDVWAAPVDKSSAPAVTGSTTNEDEQDVALTVTDDGTAPGAISTTSPADLKGTSAVLGWTLPTDTDLSGTIVRRFLNPEALGSAEMTAYVPAPLHAFTDKGLTLGTDYTYTFTPVDRSGHVGTAATRTITALLAAPTFADPTSRTSTSTTFPVVFGPVRSASAVFTVDSFGTGDPGWTNWVTDIPARSGSFTGVAGKSYTFRVVVKDGHGNTGFGQLGRAVVPFDQTKATFSGGGNVYTSAAYLGSYRKLWHSTDVARVTLSGNRLQVIGSTCGTCGVFDIYDNGTWVAGVNTYGSVTRLRQVLFTKTYSGIASHSFAIKPRATGTRRDVMLDGFAMRT